MSTWNVFLPWIPRTSPSTLHYRLRQVKQTSNVGQPLDTGPLDGIFSPSRIVCKKWSPKAKYEGLGKRCFYVFGMPARLRSPHFTPFYVPLTNDTSWNQLIQASFSRAASNRCLF